MRIRYIPHLGVSVYTGRQKNVNRQLQSNGGSHVLVMCRGGYEARERAHTIFTNLLTFEGKMVSSMKSSSSHLSSCMKLSIHSFLDLQSHFFLIGFRQALFLFIFKNLSTLFLHHSTTLPCSSLSPNS